MNRRRAFLLVPLVLLVVNIDYVRTDYTLDDSVGLGRMFDGIGGLSGGGVRYNGRSPPRFSIHTCCDELAIVMIPLYSSRPHHDCW